ncbi:MAG: hypothetical protein ABIB46_06005 [bacterium]
MKISKQKQFKNFILGFLTELSFNAFIIIGSLILIFIVLKLSK